MLASEIREMAESDIEARINELEEERFRLRFRGATENLEDPLRVRLIRRDVARLKTVQRERQIAGGPPVAAKKAVAKKRAATKVATKKVAAKKAAAKKGAAKKSAPKARTRSASKSARTAAPKARKQEP